VGWSPILLEDIGPSPNHLVHSVLHDILQYLDVLISVDYRPFGKKWGSITLPSLEMTQRTMTVAGNMVVMTMGTSL
jgi:hypothetical protein